jgi:hypothetical protein
MSSQGDLTLSQWAKDNGKRVEYHDAGGPGTLKVFSPGWGRGHDDLWKLEDFTVITSDNPWVYLRGELKTKRLTTREDILSLSYYTLCRLSDTLVVGSVEGILLEMKRRGLKGILTTDKLGNFLTIE